MLTKWTIQVPSSVSAEEVWIGGLVDVLGTANDGDQEGCLEFSLKFLVSFFNTALVARDSLKCLAPLPCLSLFGGGAGRHKKCVQGLDFARKSESLRLI